MNAHHQSKDVYRTVVQLADEGRDCVLAVVLDVDGSTPCKTGSKAIFDAEKVVCGTIGGGVVEVEAQRRAVQVIKVGRPIVLDFGLESPSLDIADPACGGKMRVLLDPAAHERREVYATALSIRERRQRGVLLTVVRGEKERSVEVECLAEREIASRVGFPNADVVRTVLDRKESQHFGTDSTPDERSAEVLVEPLIPTPVVLIVGGGHVGQAVAIQAGLVGFDIAVIDDRPEFTHPDRFPNGATLYSGDIGKTVAEFPFGGDTYVVIATRGHQHDAKALAACIHAQVAYIGMIGSRRKVAMVRRGFVESGRATAEELDRIYAPIGLDIGSTTVPEIATSIVAQLIAVRRKGSSPRFAPLTRQP